MKRFNYSYSHKYGTGQGSVEAKNSESAKKKVADSIVVPDEVGGEFDEKGKLVGAVKTGGKPTNLKITVEEAPEIAE